VGLPGLPRRLAHYVPAMMLINLVNKHAVLHEA
jgi:hypothetical protein